MKLRYPLIALGCLAVIGILLVVGVSFFGLFMPTNARDNANPGKRAEMIELTLKWGRLAPFPETAQDFTIHTEGGMFTRTFRGSFYDSRENVKRWLDASPGVREGRFDDVTTILKTGEGAAYGTVDVSSDGTEVMFSVSWS